MLLLDKSNISSYILWPKCFVVSSQELQEQVAEQRRLLQSVASVGEELLSHQTTPNGDRYFFSSLYSCRTHFVVCSTE